MMALGPDPRESKGEAQHRRDCAKGGGPKERTGICPRCGEAYENTLANHLPDCEGEGAGVSDAGPGTPLTDGGEPTTHVGEEGLWMPPSLREFEAQLVIRTPAVTVQYFSSDGETAAYYPLVRPHHFGPAEAFEHLQNPDLAPDRVRIKPQGEPAVELTVTGADGECPAPDATTEGDA
jgi:hypothetical protein